MGSIFKGRKTRTTYTFAADSGARCMRFEKLQDFVIDLNESLSPSARLCGLLLGLDAIGRSNSWEAAYAAVGERHYVEANCRISWIGANADVEARYLSVITVAHIERHRVFEAFASASSALMAAVCAAKIYPLGCSSDELLKDALAWNYTHLGSLLTAHVGGDNLMAALPLSAIAREVTKLPVRPAAIVGDEQPPETESADRREELLGLCFEAALAGTSSSDKSDKEFVLRKLVPALRPRGTSKVAQRIAVRAQLTRLLPLLETLGEVPALLFAYSWHLVVDGTTLAGRSGKAGTPYRYVQPIAECIVEEFAEKPFSKTNDLDYEERFRTLAKTFEGNAPALTGLRGFHRFLRNWWEAPRLPGDVFKVDGEAEVCANLIWPHESELIDGWLRESGSVRVYEQVRLAHAIACETPIRSGELFCIRCRDVEDYGDHFVIALARDLRDGREKTQEGRRRITVRDRRAVELLRTFCERRLTEEAALPGHLLFGTKDEAEVVHARGKMYYLMNWLPKAATGDAAASFHTHRHSTISFELANIFRRRAESEVGEEDQLAADSGHIHAAVSARFYGHLFEPALRDRVDRAVFHPRRGWAAKLAAWLDVTHDNLRQALCRAVASELECGEYDSLDVRVRTIRCAFDARREASSSVDYSILCAAEAPASPLTARVGPASLAQVWRVLRDVSQGHSFATASAANAVTVPVVEQLVSSVGDIADRFGEARRDPLPLEVLGRSALLDRPGTVLGCPIEFRSDLLRQLTLPDACDAEALAALAQACEYWKRNRLNRYLLVTSSSLLRPFLGQLKSLGLKPSALSLRVAAPHTSRLAVAQSQIASVFKRRVRSLTIRPRADRPDLYLVVAPNASGPDLRGHGASSLWLHSVMLAAAVWITYLEGFANDR